ncbi:Plasmid mobilization relaxosome protein MobC, partial [Dysosmobacter welbionis]
LTNTIRIVKKNPTDSDIFRGKALRRLPPLFPCRPAQNRPTCPSSTSPPMLRTWR